MSVKRYLLSPENLIEVSVMVLLTIILLGSWAPSRADEHDLRRIFAAYAIVLSWAELIVLVGKHPKLSRLNVYATMFFKVGITKGMALSMGPRLCEFVLTAGARRRESRNLGPALALYREQCADR